MLHHMGHAHGQRPLETLNGILKSISRVHDNMSKPTSSMMTVKLWTGNCKNNINTCTWIINNNNLSMLQGLYGRCKDEPNLAGQVFPDVARAANSFTSKVNFGIMHSIYTGKMINVSINMDSHSNLQWIA